LNIPNKFCEATRLALSDSMDAQPLSSWRRFTVWAHTHFCPGCRPVWRSLHATKDALAALRDADVTPEGDAR
jgi:hypothetical protein